MPNFTRPQRPVSPIETALSYGLSQLAMLPFEKAREKRQEERQIASEARAVYNAIEQAKAMGALTREDAAANAVAAAEAALAGGLAAGTTIPFEKLSPAAQELLGQGKLQPSAVKGSDVFFSLPAIEAAKAGERPVEPETETLIDRIRSYVDPKAVTEGPTTERALAQVSPLLGEGLSIRSIEAQREANRALREQTAASEIAQLIQLPSQDDFKQFGGMIYTDETGDHVLNTLDMTALLNEGRLGMLSESARQLPGVQELASRAAVLNKAQEEGRLRYIRFNPQTMEAVLKPFLSASTGGESVMATRDAMSVLSANDLLWEVKGKNLDRIAPRAENEPAVLAELRQNVPLREAYAAFRTARDMQDIRDSERVPNGAQLSPQALGYLQLMFKKAGVQDWRHPKASYEGLADVKLPREVINAAGVLTKVSPTPSGGSPRVAPAPAFDTARGADFTRELAGGAVPGTIQPSRTPQTRSTQSATFTLAPVTAFNQTEAGLQLRDEIFTQLKTTAKPDSMYAEIQNWITNDLLKTPEGALDFTLGIGLPEEYVRDLADTNANVRNAAHARIVNQVLQVAKDAREEFLAQQRTR